MPAKTGPATGDFQMALVNARSIGSSACGVPTLLGVPVWTEMRRITS